MSLSKTAAGLGVSAIAALLLAGCGNAPDAARDAVNAPPLSKSGYPIGAVYSEFVKVCDDLTSNKQVYDIARKQGWVIEPTLDPAIEPLVKLLDGLNFDASTDVTAVPPMAKNVEKEKLFLLITDTKRSGQQRIECHMFDPGETRSVYAEDISVRLGREPVEERKGEAGGNATWVPGLEPDHVEFTMGFGQRDKIKSKMNAMGGLMLTAAKNHTLKAN